MPDKNDFLLFRFEDIDPVFLLKSNFSLQVCVRLHRRDLFIVPRSGVYDIFSICKHSLSSVKSCFPVSRGGTFLEVQASFLLA